LRGQDHDAAVARTPTVTDQAEMEEIPQRLASYSRARQRPAFLIEKANDFATRGRLECPALRLGKRRLAAR
jgi:hypothetical protein